MIFCLIKSWNSELYKKKLKEYNDFSKKDKNKINVILLDFWIKDKDKKEIIKDNLHLKIHFDKNLNKESIINIIEKNWNKKELLIIPGANDLHVNLVKTVYDYFGIDTTKNINIFTNKKELRKELKEKMYENNINSFTINKEDYNDCIEKSKIIKFPLILKAINWSVSNNVFFIKDEKELKFFFKKIQEINKEFQIEEYITWKMYSIDFFVNWNWNVWILPMLRIETSKELKLNKDFWNIIVKNEDYNFRNNEKISILINKLAKNLKLKRQFCHLEFFLTKEGNIKIIEINWRLGWYRIELYNSIFDKTILNLIHAKNLTNIELKNNTIFLKIYSFVEKEKNSWKYSLENLYNIINNYNWKIVEEYKIIKSWIEKIWPANLSYKYPYCIIIKTPKIPIKSQKMLELDILKEYNNYIINN